MDETWPQALQYVMWHHKQWLNHCITTPVPLHSQSPGKPGAGEGLRAGGCHRFGGPQEASLDRRPFLRLSLNVPTCCVSHKLLISFIPKITILTFAFYILYDFNNPLRNCCAHFNCLDP